ncbi:hypothetical protein KDW_02390 [Dictyobacter vulcani]|uniref:Protein-L-isoaspartate O-methyltransferase n=1 Tax=Dictyobacter vulcani TaxID=2607529 RepID=A0A5J4KHX2_9CHLR|nr:hypothetical protein [Dictyobacter vulcani]GER86077.1 hypothetical protein KDW_02390 [Dictyobacter vulcani]
MMFTLLAETYKDSVPFRKHLVTYLKEQDILHSPSIESALLMIPREAFVPVFFHTNAQSLSTSTLWITFDTTHPDYSSQVYQDQPLITHLNSYGMPDSSSSMPSVMVQMLEALDIQSNHTVLEIGTGTGYNAALIAYLAAGCTTIDREPAYVEQVHQIIQHFHLDAIRTYIADGVKGYPEYAPYDRIIVTASTPLIPMAWVDQLHAGGRLVCDLAGPLARAFLILDKIHHEMVNGLFLPIMLNFMPMQSDLLPHIQYSRFPKIVPMQEIQLDDDSISMIHDLLGSHSFRWFLQWHQRHIKLQQLIAPEKAHVLLIAPDERSYIDFSRVFLLMISLLGKQCSIRRMRSILRSGIMSYNLIRFGEN